MCIYRYNNNRYKVQEYDCIPKLTDAKRDLYHYIKSLCNSQEAANSADRDSSSVTSMTIESVGSTQSTTQRRRRRGILYTGGVDHLKKIYESIYGMILLNISLPVEVWVNWEDQHFCEKVIGRLAKEYHREVDINCKILPTSSSSHQSKSSHMGIAARKSFMCKFTALLSTTFTDVIFIDADNLRITAKVAALFDSDEYRATGAIIWPDIFGEKCRETSVREHVVDPGITAWRTHCVYQAKMGGLKWEDTFPLAQEAETGQIALNLRKHGALIEFAKVLMEHDFFRTVFYGDKDLFRYVFLLMEESFYFVPHYPGLSVYLSDPSSVNSLRVDSLIQYFPSSSSLASSRAEFEPYFFHQLKLRNSDSFRQALVIDPNVHSRPSVCIQSSGCDIEVLDEKMRNNSPHRLAVNINTTASASASISASHLLNLDSYQQPNKRSNIRQRSLNAVDLVTDEDKMASSRRRSLQQADRSEKLYLQTLETGDKYARLAQQVFTKGDTDWVEINSTWYRMALILHRMYGIFQAVYFQIIIYVY